MSIENEKFTQIFLSYIHFLILTTTPFYTYFFIQFPISYFYYFPILFTYTPTHINSFNHFLIHIPSNFLYSFHFPPSSHIFNRYFTFNQNHSLIHYLLIPYLYPSLYILLLLLTQYPLQNFPFILNIPHSNLIFF